MKTCPICKARCFNDMEICYGCMHPFGPEEDAEQSWCEEQVEGCCNENLPASRTVESAPSSIPLFELVEGPLAMASLGNGYRLVLCVERK